MWHEERHSKTRRERHSKAETLKDTKRETLKGGETLKDTKRHSKKRRVTRRETLKDAKRETFEGRDTQRHEERDTKKETLKNTKRTTQRHDERDTQSQTHWVAERDRKSARHTRCRLERQRDRKTERHTRRLILLFGVCFYLHFFLSDVLCPRCRLLTSSPSLLPTRSLFVSEIQSAFVAEIKSTNMFGWSCTSMLFNTVVLSMPRTRFTYSIWNM